MGEVAKYSFSDSRIFPGTEREYWVYVPSQYDPGTPACLFVCQDGIRFEAPAAFDALIAAGEMPVTIGVFVMHGKVPPPTGDALPRFNRSVEYDGLGDDYARFLIEELLPDVESKTAADGRPIRISRDPNDRAIGGASSGAICAFTAAWERPDSFRRVFSAIGTYVGLRGGDDYPTLIRKVEPKPIRVFLEDGSGDLDIYGGDWWMANQEMERALAFSGYEVEHAWGEGGHDSRHATEIFPEAMRWLWADWPRPVGAGPGSPQLQEILIPEEGWQLVADGYRSAGGPAANDRGEVYFNDIPDSKTYKINLDGSVVEHLDDSKGADGQAFVPGGRRLVVATETGQVLSYDESGEASVIAEGFRGGDLVATPGGGVYVTDPTRGGGEPGKIWFIPPDGGPRVVDTGPGSPSGVALSPDRTLLYVADAGSRWVSSHRIRADGSLEYTQKYFHLHVPDSIEDGGGDGLAVDRDGRLYVASRMGLQVCDQAGRVNAIIPTPGAWPTGVCFGGPGFDTLFVTCGDAVYRRKVRARGLTPSGPPITPEAPRL
ncbi:SMP-30/gluconolactonase/LRE family protein [Tautonia plasticadhaerens]|uniref:Gluconolactonase n=1 Tax=Tautonia plasticadhaerens TaxID=2527974 RepID=A0A518HF69_9BACT|nr:SMP-30/gluconolactonase/LRE family protein [Tautonia plasticadhaerens]QDV39499.1 Gluconolactonase precursor [Tautonia plasticadhaerens]